MGGFSSLRDMARVVFSRCVGMMRLCLTSNEDPVRNKKMKENGVEDNVFLKKVVDKFIADETLLLKDVKELVNITMNELS